MRWGAGREGAPCIGVEVTQVQRLELIRECHVLATFSAQQGQRAATRPRGAARVTAPQGDRSTALPSHGAVVSQRWELLPGLPARSKGLTAGRLCAAPR